MAEFTTVPVIDIEPFLAVPPSDGLCARKLSVAKQIREACSDVGFFYVLGHGIHKSLEENLESCASAFFDEADEVKMTIRMALGGPAWRGYFAVGEELTSGLPDQKEVRLTSEDFAHASATFRSFSGRDSISVRICL